MLNSKGELVKAKHFDKNGSIMLRNLIYSNLNNDEPVALISSSDTLIDKWGNLYFQSPYGNTYICTLDENWDIKDVKYFTSAEGNGLTNISFSSKNNLNASVLYLGPILVLNDLNIIDSNKLGRYRFIIWQADSTFSSLKDKNTQSNLKVFPNPSTGNLCVQIEDVKISCDKLSIISLDGNIVYSNIVLDNYTTCSDLQELPPSMYTIVLYKCGKILKHFKWLKV